MKVTRTSGLPIDGAAQYKEELDKGMIAITDEMGRFEKIADSKKQGEFIKRFEDMKAEVAAKYVFETDWDFETVLKSKTKLKELCNVYGAIAFTRGDSDQIECFIIDSKI